MPTRTTIFTTTRTEGALLPADLLQRISDGTNIDGLTPESYHRPGEKINEAINRSWNALQGAWVSFRAAQERLPSDDLGTSITRERWLLPLFRELDYGRLQTATAAEIDGRTYPISHRWEHVPLHLVSYKVDLDKRTPGATGASTSSPHSLLQVFLNRSDDHLWGFLSNGYKLRILRDNVSLTRQAYVEFDLEAMMTGEVYSDFVLLWLLCHQSRVEGERPSDCWLEKWMKVAEDQGTRALDQLRNGVEQAITALGLGFLEHPANTQLRDKLQSGALDGQDYYRQLLRLVYRMLFLFVAEDRSLLLDPAADEVIRDRYTKYYSTGRLRHMAEHFKGTQHPDLYESFRLIMNLLSGELDTEAGKGIGLKPLGSDLWRTDFVKDIITCQMSNAHLLDAIRALSLTYDTRAAVYRSVDYRNLGPEELGSIYESLLELHPQINIPARTFALATAGGNERKTTGSYYTPTSLINALLDSALDSVLNEAMKKGEAAILALKICDPACGSGHFLIAAANRITKALATVRTGEEEPAPAAIQEAKRDVIGHCIYGVDINPMAVELCKVNLWMEALEPGKPLSFLDHRIQCGNSLLGTTPALMAQGIPDDAFTPIEGDDPKFVTTMKKLNRDERKQREASIRQLELFGTAPAADYTALTRAMHELDATPDDTLAEIRRKEAQYAALASDPEYVKARLLADAWCAAFVWEKRAPRSDSPRPEGEGQGVRVLPPSPVTMGEGRGLGVLPLTDLLYRRLEADPLAENLRETREYIVELTQRYQFFHWHIAFPDVFTVDTRQLITDEGAAQTGWIGGFDCVLGNPPWEKINLKAEEFFAETHPEIANAGTKAKRLKLIEELRDSDASTYHAFKSEQAKHDHISNFFRYAGVYPFTGISRINLYSVFAELGLRNLATHGRLGQVIASGIVTDDNNKAFFENLISNQQLIAVWDFENSEGIFSGVHRSYKFCLLCASGYEAKQELADFAFYLTRTEQLNDRSNHFTISGSDLKILNPDTRTCPTFRNPRDAEITIKIHKLVPAWTLHQSGEDWPGQPRTPFNMSNDSNLFLSLEEIHNSSGIFDKLHRVNLNQKLYLPLYEAKLIHQFNHRYATFEGSSQEDIHEGNASRINSDLLENPWNTTMPRYWVESQTQNERFPGRWFIAYRQTARATDERTSIASVIPGWPCGHTIILVDHLSPKNNLLMCASMNAIIYDFVVRQKTPGISLSHWVWKQLPIIPPHTYSKPLLDFIVPRVLELTYTAWDLQPFAQDVGYDGPPFIWDDQRRFLMRCELDALYFHLYQINRPDVDYIMETFPIVKRKDEATHGSYRTKDTILAMYDQMAALPTLHVPAPKDASATYPVPDVGQWSTWLNPPPASPEVAHPEK